jgi:hypothetical protein
LFLMAASLDTVLPDRPEKRLAFLPAGRFDAAVP